MKIYTGKRRELYQYEEIQRIGHQYYKDAGFCTVVAVACAAKVGFGKARNAMARLGGRKHRKGATGHISRNIQQMFSFQLERIAVPAKTVNQCLKYLDEGAYWIHIRGHVFHVENHVIHDWMKSNARHHVTAIHKIHRQF